MVNRRTRMFAGAVLVFGLPLAARLARLDDPGRCALDGAALAPAYRVRLVERAGGPEREFCGVACAAGWLSHSPEHSALFVTDELTRREVPAAEAWLVRSSVVTRRATGNRIHCFADEAAARRHAREARGRVLAAGEAPWAQAAAASVAHAE
jgi:hypothetical protein